MYIHAFKVSKHKGSDRVKELIERIKGDDLAQRTRTIHTTPLRLETVEVYSGVYGLDFVRFRDKQGPGRASRKAPTRGFNLKADESFAEETAALYVPSTMHMLVQYN